MINVRMMGLYKVDRFVCFLIVLLTNVTCQPKSEESFQKSDNIQESFLLSSIEKNVFAHYMVCCPTKYKLPPIEAYKYEIVEAQKRGIDGFALNCGGWNETEPHYKERTLIIYEAAKQLNTGFKLFVSADGEALNEVEDIILSLKDHPNQFCYKGLPVLSTFGGEGENNFEGKALIDRVHQLDGAIIPFYYPRPNLTEHPQEQHAQQLLKDFPLLDGYFYFGAAGNGDQIAHSNSILAKAFLEKGKIFMAGITPYYRGNRNNFRLFETRGFESMAHEWEGVIKDGTPWVQLVTWNDWNEATYLAPFGPVDETQLWDGHWGPMMLSHVAYLDASNYYIDWFKKGEPPKIQQDKLFYFYRLHSKKLSITVNAADESEGWGQPEGSQLLLDHVFVSSFLTMPATLEIISGNKSRRFNLLSGVSHVSMPFEPGKQSFILIRNGQTLIKKFGEHQISKSDSKSRFNYFAGSAEFNPAAN